MQVWERAATRYGCRVSVNHGATSSGKRARRVDVAQLAGVSPATVSFVLNNTAGQTITDETRQRVLQAVAELGYRPNPVAQRFRLGNSATIGFVVHDADFGEFAASAIKGASEASLRQGNLLLLVNTGGSNQQAEQMITELLDRQTDALIFAAIGTRSVTVPHAASRVPTVLLNCFTPRDQFHAVLPDEERGGRESTQALLDLGHRSFAYLAGNPVQWTTKARVRGFRDALRGAGLNPSDHPVLEGNYHVDSGYDLARTLLRERSLPTALLCGNDRMAVGALLALFEAGVRVPDDVSVMGYDDQFQLAAEVRPALSTVRLPYDIMGQLATEQLSANGSTARPGRTMVHCPVILRDSTAPPHTS